ncbi:hypothetical protein M231_06488 [Tremella mesenterica]|uniref:At2g23090-like zinc-binding domain-containing protein n=1 Tax=Tremella mesenterica TaxID=5217 RepID=A0A4Q1BBL8_TREME|nr:hypothetical protein M231_06488 [Tremella mesenterica]
MSGRDVSEKSKFPNLSFEIEFTLHGSPYHNPRDPRENQVSMGGGNGAKSAKDRERKAAKTKQANKENSSQLKTNAAAQSIQCVICKATFQGTAKQPSLQLHIDSKHSKASFGECFPTYVAA